MIRISTAPSGIYLHLTKRDFVVDNPDILDVVTEWHKKLVLKADMSCMSELLLWRFYTVGVSVESFEPISSIRDFATKFALPLIHRFGIPYDLSFLVNPHVADFDMEMTKIIVKLMNHEVLEMSEINRIINGS